MSRICIYTAIYGGYDDLKPIVDQDVPCDFVCFTDRELVNPGGWQIFHVEMQENHPRMRAKFFKLLSHRIFRHGQLQLGLPWYRRWLPRRRYTSTIWIDGSVKVKSTSPSYSPDGCSGGLGGLI
jgi:hypothetical protein